jgi:hypothetical protein
LDTHREFKNLTTEIYHRGLSMILVKVIIKISSSNLKEAVFLMTALTFIAGEWRQADCCCVTDEGLANQSCAVSGMASTLH